MHLFFAPRLVARIMTDHTSRYTVSKFFVGVPGKLLADWSNYDVQMPGQRFRIYWYLAISNKLLNDSTSRITNSAPSLSDT